MFKQFFLTLATMALLLAGLDAGTGHATNGILWIDSHTSDGPHWDGALVKCWTSGCRGHYHHGETVFDCGTGQYGGPINEDGLILTQLDTCADSVVATMPLVELDHDAAFPVGETQGLNYLCTIDLGQSGGWWPFREFYSWGTACSSPGKREGEPLPAEPTTWGQIKSAYKD